MRDFFIPSTASRGNPFARAYPSGNQSEQRGQERPNPYDVRGAEQLGADWFNAFMAWVEEHKPAYPQQAVLNNQDGDSRVEFTVDRDGRVRDLQLVGRSGSVWLDLALESMFRGAHLPQFPYGASQDTITIAFTMHYILER